MNEVSKIYYNLYQEENPEKFNEELIFMKDNIDFLIYIDAIGKGLEILPGIKFIKSSKLNIKKIYKNTETEKKIDVERSILDEYCMDFLIYKGNKEDENYEEKEISLKFYFPKLIEHHFFIINGVKYKVIYQLADSGTYRNKKFLVLKNLIMPISLGTKVKTVTFEDIEGNEYEEKIFCVNMFKGNINPFLYYFAKLGYEETLKFFNIEDSIQLIDLANKEEFYDNAINFKINSSLGCSIDPDFINESEENRMIAFSFMDIFNSRSKMEKILDNDYWIKQLGSNFTKNNSVHYSKGINILISFERSLDEITKMILRVYDSDKNDVYSILRYMMRNYRALSKLDNMDLSNKRLRLEHLIYPLLLKLSSGVYRLLNKKSPTLKEIHSIFKIPKGFLISSLIKSETIQYVNSVNTYDLFSVALKGTQSGPQSPFNGNSDNMRLRALHPSYMNKLDIISTATGDPGVNFSICPFLHLYENGHFTENVDLSLIEEEDDSMRIPNTMIEDYMDDSFEKED